MAYGRLRVCFSFGVAATVVADCALVVGAIAPVKNSAAIRRTKAQSEPTQEQHTTRATHTRTQVRAERGVGGMMAASSSMHSFGWGLTCFFVHLHVCSSLCVLSCRRCCMSVLPNGVDWLSSVSLVVSTLDSLVGSSFGPCGRDAILRSTIGKILITNSGETMTQQLKAEQPSQRT